VVKEIQKPDIHSGKLHFMVWIQNLQVIKMLNSRNRAS
jgi:hypothetical protein